MEKYLDKDGLSFLCSKLMEYITQQTVQINEAKQDVIEDISTIREGAASGATAYQKSASGIPKTDLDEDVNERILQNITDEDIEQWFNSND